MKMAEKKPLEDTELEAFFAAARSLGPTPSADLVGRVLADARAENAPPERVPELRKGWLGVALAMIGGWPAVAGLATAAVTGLTIGLASSDTLDTLSNGYLATADGTFELEDLLPSYGDILGES